MLFAFRALKSSMESQQADDTSRPEPDSASIRTLSKTAVVSPFESGYRGRREMKTFRRTAFFILAVLMLGKTLIEFEPPVHRTTRFIL
jgi:hypothetical protein